MTQILITGTAGFIGFHLEKFIIAIGLRIHSASQTKLARHTLYAFCEWVLPSRGGFLGGKRRGAWRRRTRCKGSGARETGLAQVRWQLTHAAIRTFHEHDQSERSLWKYAQVALILCVFREVNDLKPSLLGLVRRLRGPFP